MYGQGISREGEIIELGSSLGIIEKSGAWYAYKGNRIGQGKDNARAYLLANKEVAREIEEQVRAKLLPPRQQRTAARPIRPDRTRTPARWHLALGIFLGALDLVHHVVGFLVRDFQLLGGRTVLRLTEA